MSRRRLALRATFLGVLLLLLIVLLARAALASWGEKRWTAAAARYEREVGSLDLASWELPSVQDEENAATWISKGSAAIVVDGKVTALAWKSPASWAPEQIAAIRRAVEQNREALAIVARARSQRASSFGIPLREGVAARVPNLLEIMQAAKLLFARAALSMHEGRREEALADLELLGEISRRLEEERVLIVLLMGAAVEKHELRLAHAFAEDPATTPEEVTRVAASLLEGDLLAAYGRSYAADGAAVCTALHAGESADLEIEPLLLRALHPAIDPRWAAACLDYYREVGAVLGRPHHEAKAGLAEVQERWRSSWFWGESAETALPNLVNGGSRMATNLALRRLAGVALAARARAFESGAYPEDAGAFPGAGEPDPLTGGPLRWRLESDGGAVLDLPGAAEIVAEFSPTDVAAALPWSFRLPPPPKPR